jgi:mRNA interferase MazF
MPAYDFGDVVLVQDWHAANLLRSSAIKPVIATIEQSLVIRRLGQLSSRDQSALRKTFATVIG